MGMEAQFFFINGLIVLLLLAVIFALYRYWSGNS